MTKKFDEAFLKFFSKEDIYNAVSNDSLHGTLSEILLNIKVINYTSINWEANLFKVYTSNNIPSFNGFIADDLLYAAVMEKKLTGDTFFTQFRGLHQIPELLTSSINEIIDKLINDFENKYIEESIIDFEKINILFLPVISSLEPLTNNLTTHDYHLIRENLGLTSGSHSLNIRAQLFQEKYFKLANLIINYINAKSTVEINFFDKNIVYQLLKLRKSIDIWKSHHINLPRNNLGGNFTKSLIGSSDAVEVAKKMKIIWQKEDPITNWINEENEINDKRAIFDYMNSEISLDSFLMSVTGDVTKSKFHNVQNREGFFSPKKQ